MDRNFFSKNIVYILFIIFFLYPACIKYYDDDFHEDVFSVPSGWYRVMSNNAQVFVNSDKELEIVFHSEKCSGAGYRLPFYTSNGVYDISITARADKKEGHIFLYAYKRDYMSDLKLSEVIVPVSERFKEFQFFARMPDEGYFIELFLTKDDINANEGRLLVKDVKINRKLINFASIESYAENENNCCFPPYRKWERWQASEKQAFINSDNVMEIKFDEKKWVSAYYHLPFYKGNTRIILKYTVRAVGQKGRLQVYDYTARKVLAAKAIDITKDFKYFTLKFRAPKDESHAIWIRFMQKNYKEIGGSLFIKKMQINKKRLDISI